MVTAEPDASCPGEWVELEPSFGYCSLGDECRRPVRDAHQRRFVEWTVDQAVVDCVKRLAPDGDWVRADEVAQHLGRGIEDVTAALHTAVQAGHLTASRWDTTTVGAAGHGDELFRAPPDR